MKPFIRAVHPVLAATDVRRSLAFYSSLGFSTTFLDDAADPRYAAVVRDSVELHLQWARAEDLPSGDRPVYRLMVSDVDAMFEEFVRAGAVARELAGVVAGAGASPWARPGDTPWGTREFHLRDPDGHGLQFYAAPRRGAAH